MFLGIVCHDGLAEGGGETNGVGERPQGMTKEKIRENRLRRIAERRGYGLNKSRRRDPNAIDYGGCMLYDLFTKRVVLGGYPFPYSASLEEIERFFLKATKRKSDRQRARQNLKDRS
jgi:hypothetical protein